ncbi:MAG: glycosyltransferase family 2 protein [Ruminococcaceae bacterium]|nr:glycosyltransferase family 2 protein [Oscillospiraceae bacterium]
MSDRKREEIKNLLSFVIPCYRSEKTIEKVYREIVETVAQKPEYTYEVITVNDCSPDGVLTVLRKLAAGDPCFKVINLAKNFGKHSAMMAGFSYVRGEYIVNLDDDCQCPMDRLWELVDPVANEGYDCATAAYPRKKESLWKRMGSQVNNSMVNMLIEPPKGVVLENFAVIKRFVCDEILKYRNPYPYVAGLVLRATHNIKMVPMEEREREDGNASGFTLIKSVELFANGLTSFSVKPLRIALILGVLFAFLGFVYGLIIIIRRLCNSGIPMGYSSIMAVQLFSSGVIMLILGMIGEYLGRIYISLNNSPQYVVRETMNTEPAE